MKHKKSKTKRKYKKKVQKTELDILNTAIKSATTVATTGMILNTATGMMSMLKK